MKNVEQGYRDSYKNLVVWKNAAELRKLIYDITANFPKAEYRRISQMRDAARSVKQNIQEGSKRKGLAELLQFIRISRGSLAELKGDVEDSYEDGLLTENQFGILNELICKTDYLFHHLIEALIKRQNKQNEAKLAAPIKLIQPISPI